MSTLSTKTVTSVAYPPAKYNCLPPRYFIVLLLLPTFSLYKHFIHIQCIWNIRHCFSTTVCSLLAIILQSHNQHCSV